MSNIVIKVEHIYKEYRLGVVWSGTLYRELQSWWAKIMGKEDPNSLITYHTSSDNKKELSEHILALNDISFEVKKGDILGIIGENGSGKSTLLKLISKITSPTKGEIKIKGRIGALLEVGTGFHQDLTGRENVYLNGAILGMKKKEITSKLDEIIDFAEIAKFIDTPVKRYSSGMYVRLAFAVAAYLDPEILIVDEVLAVGDAQFQKKCLGKMDDVSKKDGKTVLFVSHNMFSISHLCSKVLLLKNGKQQFLGNVQEGISQYLAIIDTKKGFADLEFKTSNRQGPQTFSKLLSIETTDEKSQTTSIFKMGSNILVKIEFEIFKLVEDIELTFYFVGFGGAIYGVYSSRIEGFKEFKKGRQKIMVQVPNLNLLPGNYSIGVWINSQSQAQDDMIVPALEIEILSVDNLTGFPVDYTRYKHYGILNRSLWKAV